MLSIIINNFIRETEAKIRAEYEARLQQATEDRAHLAEEIKIRKAAEERFQRDRLEWEKEHERKLVKKKQEVEMATVDRDNQIKRTTKFEVSISPHPQNIILLAMT